MTRLVVGTRGSALARTQTQTVVDALRRVRPDLDVDIQIIQTRGDATQAAGVPLSSFGEKGIFAKELETALLAGEIDLAVHSMKDLAHTLPPGLTLAAVPRREDPRDALLGAALDDLPRGARVGTGSVRRRALLLSRRPDLQIAEIRGNIDTRIQKLHDGQYDAICLAAAGLKRLGWHGEIAETLDLAWFTPDPCQGALALECRADDARTLDLVRPLGDAETEMETRAERAFVQAVGGGCRTPMAAIAAMDDGVVELDALIAAPDGRTILRQWETHESPEEVARRVAANLREQGADALLAQATDPV